MVVVPSSLAVAARGLRPGDQLWYRDEDDSQHAVIPCRGPVRVLMRNGSLGFRSGGENSRTLDEGEGLIDALQHPFLFAEENVHDLATEILTILFPPPKHLSIGELSKSMRGLTH